MTADDADDYRVLSDSLDFTTVVTWSNKSLHFRLILSLIAWDIFIAHNLDAII